MAVGAGVSAQFGYVSESAWGTLVTVTKFLEIVSEGVKNDGGTRIVSRGLKAGRAVNHRAARGVVHIGGPITMELPSRDIAPFLRYVFGTASGASSPFTYTPGDLSGDSFTAQVGRPSTDGTVQPFTWGGCKIASWELAAEVDQYVMFTPTITAKSETTATALATASYSASNAPFVFTGAVLSGAGAPAAVNGFTLTGDNGIPTREGVGSAAIREQVSTHKTYSGTITAEFDGLTKYADFVAQTQRALVITLTSGSDTLVITMNVEFTGESPVVEGPDILTLPLAFDCISATSDAAAITAVLTNGDANTT